MENNLKLKNDAKMISRSLTETNEDDASPSLRDRAKLLPLCTWIPTLREKGEIALGAILDSEHCEMTRQEVLQICGNQRQIDLLKIELLRWREADYPGPKEWPLSSLCLRFLGIKSDQ